MYKVPGANGPSSCLDIWCVQELNFHFVNTLIHALVHFMYNVGLHLNSKFTSNFRTAGGKDIRSTQQCPICIHQ